jgi:GAF domain-containing protein
MATMSALIHHAPQSMSTRFLFHRDIGCDVRSRSDIGVPMLNRNGGLLAVLDIDGDVPGAFDGEDQRGLERFVSWFADTNA